MIYLAIGFWIMSLIVFNTNDFSEYRRLSEEQSYRLIPTKGLAKLIMKRRYSRLLKSLALFFLVYFVLNLIKK